jgi:predicted permease
MESVATGFSNLRSQYGASLTVLLALTTTLLIIGCVNLSGLVLARATRRRQQIAVRIALGASHGRIVQHVLVEVVLLVAAGLVVAALVAWWATRTLTTMLSIGRTVPMLRALTPNTRVLIVSAVVSAVISLLIAVLPAWRSVRIPANSMLQHGRTITGWNGRAGVVLLMCQVTLSMVLAVGAGLFARSLAHLQANDAVFRDRPVLWARIWRKPGDRQPLDATYWHALTTGLSAIRGVDAVATSQYFPAYLAFPGVLTTDSYSLSEDASHTMPALTEVVSPRFFETLGIQRLQGRDFSWGDDGHTTGVAIINETAARQLFPASDRLGQHLHVVEGGNPVALEVVGVVADAPIGRLREPHQAVVFRPLLQESARAQVPDVHVRITGDISFVRGEYVRVVQALGHHIVRGLFTLDGWLDFAVLQERLVVQIAMYAALLAVLLGCVGIYGLLAYSVAVRVPEIGVRMALGATRVEVVRMIAGDGVRIIAVGVMVGAACAVAAGRYVQSQLYGLSGNDPTTIAAAAGVFLFTGLAAAMLPALRGARLDPMTALRSE